MILLIGALLGFFSVLFGAYSEHGLRPNITDEEFRQIMTALRYNQFNSVVICLIGLGKFFENSLLKTKFYKWSGFLFILGTLLFSFSIYFSIGLQIPKLLYLTPVGGITLMIAWLCLATSAFLTYKKTVC